MPKYIVEFIGTFFLALTIGLAAVAGVAGNLAPIAIGAGLMAMIFAGGHISGAHYNPAVTLAAWIRGVCPTRDIVPYVVAQLAAALAASLVVRHLRPDQIAAIKLFHPVAAPALLSEFLFTFALVFVILNVATAIGTRGNSFYGLAIGFTVTAGAFAVGPISGAAFNPAVAVHIALLGFISWADIWVYLVANFAGAAGAAWAFKIVNPPDAPV